MKKLTVYGKRVLPLVMSVLLLFPTINTFAAEAGTTTETETTQTQEETEVETETEPEQETTDTQVSPADYADAIISAVYYTSPTDSGYCAAWVTQVLQNAGVLTYDPRLLRDTEYSYAVTSGLADENYCYDTGWNGNDYWKYVCFSDNYDELKPGMVVASRNTYTYLGSQFGHVGIYLGDGLVASSVGYLEILNINDWIAQYSNMDAGSSVAWGYMPLSA